MQKTQKKTTKKNGGVRPGAGRKPKPASEKHITVSLSLSPDIHGKLSILAETKGVTVNDAIREMIAKSTRKIPEKTLKGN